MTHMLLQSGHACSSVKPKPFTGLAVGRSFNGQARPAHACRLVARVKFDKVSSPSAIEDDYDGEETGFRWDPANLRWVRSNKTATNLDIAQITVQPRTGTPYVVWPAIHSTLRKAGLKTITVDEAHRLQQEEGWTLADVRTAENFDKEHCVGAINLPLFRTVQGSGFYDRLKTVVMRYGLNMAPTERDPDFQEKVQAKIPTKTKLIVYCGLGGTLKVGVKDPKGYKRNQKVVDDPERQFGRESRSLKAAYELLQAGYTKVLHMEGGLGQWRHSGYPTESSK